MSGGVDSSVAAALLKDRGHEIVGVTMIFETCGSQGVLDAKKVAEKLDFSHHTFSFGHEMEEKVIRNFIDEYRKGRTPNPCIRCNETIKFNLLFQKMTDFGCDYFATGHYVRLAESQGIIYLKKAAELKKDQSYFLYRLKQDILKKVIFPIGGYSKTQVRELARKKHLDVAEKKESQDICFASGSFKEFMKKRLSECATPGPIVDAGGKEIGRHEGVAFYTIGQRDGLGVAVGRPVYVSRIDAKNNVIQVGDRDELMKKTFFVQDTVYSPGMSQKKSVYGVRVRHVSGESPATVIPEGDGCEVTFKEPVFAITPGQSAVFYKKDRVMGGGIIQQIID